MLYWLINNQLTEEKLRKTTKKKMNYASNLLKKNLLPNEFKFQFAFYL